MFQILNQQKDPIISLNGSKNLTEGEDLSQSVLPALDKDLIFLRWQSLRGQVLKRIHQSSRLVFLAVS